MNDAVIIFMVITYILAVVIAVIAICERNEYKEKFDILHDECNHLYESREYWKKEYARKVLEIRKLIKK